MKVNADFLIEFLREWYTDLNHTWGMSKLVEDKSSSSSSSSLSSLPSRSSTPPSSTQTQARGRNPAVGVASQSASTKPAAKASVAAVDSYAPRASFGGGPQRQGSSWRQPWSNGGQRWAAPAQQWASPRPWNSYSPQNGSRQAPRASWGATSGPVRPTWGAPSSGAVEETCVVCGASHSCLLYTSPSPRDATLSRMPSSA